MAKGKTVVCPVCGGDGWTDGSLVRKNDSRMKTPNGNTICVACDGKGLIENVVTKTTDERD